MRDAGEETIVRYQTSPEIRRSDFRVGSDPNIEIAVRKVVDPNSCGAGMPVVLLHGARAASVASFDLDVPGGSLAGDLAASGHTVFLMDARGYGHSTRPDSMNRPPDENGPVARSDDVVPDIHAVVENVRERTDRNRVALMGWATGSQWLAHYAATYPANVSHLILYNALWPAAGNWSIGDDLEDPENPGYLRDGALSAYGFATGEALLGRWETSIPIDAPNEWRDPDVAAAYAHTAVFSDPTAGDREPASLRTPLGAMADSFLLSRGHQLFDPARITASVLVVRSENDFWSRPVDFETPPRDLVSARVIEREVLPGATHFAHLDRPEHGRNALLALVREFLRTP